MKTIDTRDLYTRKCELEDLRDAVTTAREELEDAQEALDAFEPYTELPEHLEDIPVASTAEALERLNSMEEKRLAEAVTDAEDALESAEQDFGTDEAEELAELEELESEINDFMHGETMIPEIDFKDYAREFAENRCDMRTADKWPFTCIDWEQAAEELATEYTEVTYQGDTYLVRA